MDPLWLSIYMVIQVTETGQIKKYRSNLSKTFILPKPFETLSVLDLKKKKKQLHKKFRDHVLNNRHTESIWLESDSHI